MKLSLALVAIATVVSSFVFAQQQPSSSPPQREAARRTQTTGQEEVLKADRAQWDAFLRRDAAAMERLVAGDFLQVVPDGVGNKETLIGFLKRTPADPTLTLTTENPQVRVDGDTAVLVARRVERRRRPDNNAEGTAYARYTRTFVRRAGRWQLLSEHVQTIPAERTAHRIDPQVYDDYVGRYDSPIFAFVVVREGDRLVAVPEERERPQAELLPESEAEFFIKGRDVQIVFVRDRKGRVTHALLRLNGAEVRAKRVG
jgi:ketosteroid isomerase-like protein